MSDMQITPLALGVAVVVALVAGFAAGNFLATPQEKTAGFSMEDKNFLVNVANGQIDLTTARLAAAIDWCVANGGQWNIVQQMGQVAVNQQTAAQLIQSDADVVQDANGNYIANVAVLSRDTCIFPVAKQGS